MIAYISNSPDDTAKVAVEFANILKPSDVVCLNGDLGAGKTAFTQALCQALHTVETVSSPTFTIVNEYHGDLTVYHFDTYRIDDPDEMEEIGFEEYIYGEGVCIIEWAQKIAELLPPVRYDITIEKDDLRGDDFRRICIEKLCVGKDGVDR